MPKDMSVIFIKTKFYFRSFFSCSDKFDCVGSQYHNYSTK